MRPSTPPRAERRHDRRIQVEARVRLLPRDGRGGAAGRLIDVSAGGLRAGARHWGGVRPGEPVDVELTVKEGGEAAHPALVHLRGAALVLRLVLDDEGAEVAALRFVGPLSLREPFAQMLLF